MHKFALTTFLSLLFCFSCSSNSETGSVQEKELAAWKTPNDKIKALSTIGMINDLVKRVGGEHVDTLTLVQGELDPHSYQLVKGDNEKFLYADVIFYNGLGLEHGVSLQKYLYNNSDAIGLGEELKNHDPNKILIIDGQPDPHIWMDISLWQATVPFIVEGLSKKDPEHAAEYKKNGEKLIQEMETTNRKISQLLAIIPPEKRYLVTSHDAFNYFTRAYLATSEERKSGDWKKRFAAPEGLAPESQLSPHDIKMILSFLKDHHVYVLFPESNVSQDSIRKIIHAGSKEGLTLIIASPPLYGDAMGPPGSSGDTYLKMIVHNAELIEKFLNN